MKKTLAILLMAVMGFGYASQARAEFKIGPRLGLNVNKLSFDGNLLDGANRCGFTGGVQAEYMIPLINLGFDLSLMYSYMDYEAEVKNSNLQADPKFGKNFLEIPLNIKYKIGLPVVGKIFAPYVFTGPSVAFRLDGDDSMFTKSARSQWVWNLGLGLEFIRHLQIGASYGWGMNNVVKGKKVAGVTVNTDEIKARTNYWTVTAAWLF